MALYISLKDFRIPSLEPGEHEKDERLDRSVLVVALGVVSGGMAFLLGMVFLLFPEWIRPIAFGPGFSEPRVYAVLLRPDAAAKRGGSQETPFHQAQATNVLIHNPVIGGSVRFPNTAQTPSSANPTVSVNPPSSGQASAPATPASTGQAFGGGAGNSPGQLIVLPPASAQPVPVPNTATQNPQVLSHAHNPRSAAAGHGNQPIGLPPASAQPVSMPNGTRSPQGWLTHAANSPSAGTGHGGGRKLVA